LEMMIGAVLCHSSR